MKAKIVVGHWKRPDGKDYVSVSRIYKGKASSRTHRIAIPLEEWMDFRKAVNDFEFEVTVLTIPPKQEEQNEEQQS